jgi:peptidase M50-like protein
MHQLRRFLCGLFAISSLFCLRIAVLNTSRLIYRHNLPLHLRFLLVPAVFWFLAIINGVAFWTGWREKRSGRPWGIAASSTYLLLPLSLSYFWPSAWRHFSATLAIGVAGIIAFASRYETSDSALRSRQIRKAPGDGTSELLNRALPFLGFALSVGIIFLVDRWSKARGTLETHGSQYGIASILLIVLCITTLHELGHTFTGLALGMKLRAFAAGPFEWRVRSGKWSFQFKPAQILIGGGATGVVPTAADLPRSHYLAMTLAGPLVNLLTGSIALAVAFTAAINSTVQAGGRLALFGAWSLGLSFLNLLPFKTGDAYSDGANIYQLLSQGPWGDYHRVSAVVGASLVTPLRPRDFDIDMIRRAAEGITEGIQALLLRLYAYLFFLDRERIPEAAQALRDAECVYLKSVSDLPAQLHTEFVFGSAYVWRDAIAAREWWTRMETKKPTRFNEDYWRAYSSLLWIEGAKQEADAAWMKCDAMVQQLPKAGAYEFDRYCCSLLRKALDEASETD